MKKRKQTTYALEVTPPQVRKPRKTNGNGNGHGKLSDGVFLQATMPPFVTEPLTLEGVQQKVFLDRYSLKDVEGKPMETHPEEMWWRVANGIAHQEKPQLREYW